MGKKQQKQYKTKAGVSLGYLVVIAVVMFGAVFGALYVFQQSPAGGGAIMEQIQQTQESANCPDTGYTSTKIEVRNLLNDTATDEYDVTLVCKSEGGDIAVITDTTDPSGTNLLCSKPVTCYAVSSGDENGDQGKLLQVQSGDAIIQDGALKFTPIGASTYVSVGAHKQGAVEVRAYDTNAKAWACAGDSSTCGTWNETDGVTFGDTSDGTAVSVGAGDEVCYEYEIRPTQRDNDLNDRGFLILVDASSSKWEEPVATLNGVALSNAKDQLNSDEQVAYADYEYAYLIPEDQAITQAQKGILDICFTAKADPGASDDISIDLTSRGSYRSTLDDNVVKIGAVKDDTAKTQVHTLFDTVIDVS